MHAVWKLDHEKLLLKKQAKIGKVITLDDLAREMGVSRQTLYTWRTGVKAIPADHAARLADYFECRVWDLWKLEVTEEDPQGQRVAVAAV